MSFMQNILHGGDLKPFIVLASIIISGSTYSSIFKHKIDSDINSVIKNKELHLSKADLYLAENLSSIYKVVSSG